MYVWDVRVREINVNSIRWSRFGPWAWCFVDLWKQFCVRLDTDWSVRFSTIQDGICALGKAHMCSAWSLRSFPQRRLWNGSNVRLIDDGPLSSFQGRSSSVSSFHASLLQAIGGVMPLALCLHVVSQASQHFRSSEKQATCEGCFAPQPPPPSTCLPPPPHSPPPVYLHGYFPSLQDRSPRQKARLAVAMQCTALLPGFLSSCLSEVWTLILSSFQQYSKTVDLFKSRTVYSYYNLLDWPPVDDYCLWG